MSQMIGQSIGTMLGDYVRSTIFGFFSWLFATFGVGGLVGLVAALLLCLAVGFKAMKLLSSTRGMAVMAAVMLLGLGFMLWPQGNHGPVPPPPPPPPRIPDPEDKSLVVKDDSTTEEASPEEETLAASESEPDLSIEEIAAALPMFGAAAPMQALPLLPSMNGVTLPPIIVPLPQNGLTHRPAPKATHTGSTPSRPGLGAASAPTTATVSGATVSGARGNRAASVAGRQGSGSGSGMGNGSSARVGPSLASSGGAAFGGGHQMTAAQQAKQARIIANRQAGAQMDIWLGQTAIGSGMHPMGGMSPMGVGHPGTMHSGGMHTGSMGHTGGHR